MNELLKNFSNVPEPRQEDKVWLQSTTPTREDKEIVIVKIAPSKMFDAFAEEYTDTIDNYYTGPFVSSRPQITTNRSFRVEDGKSALTEEQIIAAYGKTILYASIASVKKKYSKAPHLKDLIKHIQTQRVCVPVLLINAINCVGPIDIVDKAMRLEVEFADKWDYEKEILTKEQFVAVSSWFEQLMPKGFDCVEFAKIGADGNRDFMLMTLEITELPNEGTNPWDNTKFVLRSEKVAANIVALYRYFFWSEDIQYLSSARRIFKFGSYETTEQTMRSIVKTMLKVDVEELFTRNKVASEQSEAKAIEEQEAIVEVQP